MIIDPLPVIGVIAVIVLIAFLLKVKWNFKGPQKPAPQENSTPQFHTSSAPPRPAKKPVSLSSLTRRERDIVQLLKQDLTNDQIADELKISTRTVNKHLEHIFYKLRVRSRAELVEWSPDDEKSN